MPFSIIYVPLCNRVRKTIQGWFQSVFSLVLEGFCFGIKFLPRSNMKCYTKKAFFAELVNQITCIKKCNRFSSIFGWKEYGSSCNYVRLWRIKINQTDQPLPPPSLAGLLSSVFSTFFARHSPPVLFNINGPTKFCACQQASWKHITSAFYSVEFLWNVLCFFLVGCRCK